MQPPVLEVIYSDAVSTLYYDSSVPCSHIIWHGFASSADFRAACMRSLELMQARSLYKGISDARNLRIIGMADQQWFTEEFVPQVLSLGLSPVFYSAVVVPNDFFGRQSLDQIVEQVDDVMAKPAYHDIQVRTEYFDNSDAARQWLKHIDETDQYPNATSAEDSSPSRAEVA
jgi:hypothetical protein